MTLSIQTEKNEKVMTKLLKMKQTERQAERQAERHTDRHTDRYTGRHVA